MKPNESEDQTFDFMGKGTTSLVSVCLYVDISFQYCIMLIFCLIPILKNYYFKVIVEIFFTNNMEFCPL